MFRVSRTTESHISTLDSSISRETFGSDATLFCWMQGPALGPFLKIRILNVGEKERIFGQHFRFTADGIMPVKLSRKPDSFFVRQKGGPPFQAGDARQHAM